jgi:hypothetical protein
MTEKKDIEVVFAPGSMDNFEGTPEELAGLVAEIKNMAMNGTLLENSTPVTEEEEEEFIKLMNAQIASRQ